MRESLLSRSKTLLLGTLVVAGLSALTLCLPAAAGEPARAVAARGAASHPLHSTAPSSLRNATRATTLAASATGGPPAGGVLGDVNGDGYGDIVAIDPAGRLWVYLGGSLGFNSTPLVVGSGWHGYTLAAVAPLAGNGLPGLLAIDPAGNLWYYPNEYGTGNPIAFGTPTQVGIGWAGYTVVALTGLYGTGAGVLAIDPSGNLVFYPGTGGTGLSTFGAPAEIGPGWTGYTVDIGSFTTNQTQLLAVDPAGNLWLYPAGQLAGTFGAPELVGSGWQGWQAVDTGEVSQPLNAGNTDAIVAIDPSGTMWIYPNNFGDEGNLFAPRDEVGPGWTGYRIN
jgi:hypothetical protein